MQFVIDEAQDGWFWILKGGNGKVLCVSERLESREACVEVIAAVREGVAEAVTLDNTLSQHVELP
jgi:uncharacterized protein YegP (UPF0339 family)